MTENAKSKRPFLLRLMITTLAVCLIPMLFLSARYFQTRRTSLQASEQTRLNDTANRIAARMDEFMQDIESIQSQHRKLQYLSDSALKSGVSSEMEAIDMLEILNKNHSFLSESGFILMDEPNVVYLSEGKYELKYFTSQVLAMTEAVFLNKVNQLSSPVFLPWNPDKLYTVYLYPERRITSAKSARISLYIITRSSLLSAVEHLLTDGCELDFITDEQGQIIYQSGNKMTADIWDNHEQGQAVLTIDGKSIYRDCAVSSAGLTVYLHKSESTMAQSLQKEMTYLMLVLAAISIATMLCALLAVWYNYQPIRQVISEVGEDSNASGSKSEIHFLYDAYFHQKSERQKLESKVDLQRKMILDRVYKCLLNGRPLTNQEFDLLHWQNNYFFVAAADSMDVGMLEAETIQRLDENYHIRVVNMKADRLYAFICLVNDNTRQEQARLTQPIMRALISGARLGVSRVYQTMDDFRTAYTESTLAEQSTLESGVYHIDDLTSQQKTLFFENNFDTMQLINQLHNHDEAAVDSVRRMMKNIEWNAQDKNMRLYSEFRLMEYLRSALSKVGILYDEARFAHIMGIQDQTQRTDALCMLIHDSLKQREDQLLVEKDQLAQEMMLYIEEHYCNSELSLEMLAERFEMSVTSASKVFKDVTGSNFKKYVNERRLTQAKLLLDTTRDSVAAVAQKVGFSSASYFIQVFKSAEGMTPANWREQKEN